MDERGRGMNQAPSTSSRRAARGKLVPVQLRFLSGVRVSPKAFGRICADNRDLRLERAANGEMEVMAPAGSESGYRNASITGQLWSWNQVAKRGAVFDSSGGFTLSNTAVRAPDATWIAIDRWNQISAKDRERFAEICPDFVVELLSPSDDLPRVRRKMQEYLDQGVRLAWLIDPYSQTVEIFRPGRPVESLTRPATLSGEDVLPGFNLDLKGILFE